MSAKNARKRNKHNNQNKDNSNSNNNNNNSSTAQQLPNGNAKDKEVAAPPAAQTDQIVPTEKTAAPEMNGFAGLYKNERMTQALTACVGVGAKVTVVNGAEYSGFFHTFGEDSDIIMSTTHRTKIPYHERFEQQIKQQQTKKRQQAAGASSSKGGNAVQGDASSNGPTPLLPLQVNSSTDLPKPELITDDMIFGVENFVMLEFNEMDLNAFKKFDLSKISQQLAATPEVPSKPQPTKQPEPVPTPTPQEPPKVTSPAAKKASVEESKPDSTPASPQTVPTKPAPEPTVSPQAVPSELPADPAILSSTMQVLKPVEPQQPPKQKSKSKTKFKTDEEIATKASKKEKGKKELVVWQPDAGDSDSEKYKLDAGPGWDVNDMYRENEEHGYRTQYNPNSTEYTNAMVEKQNESVKDRNDRIDRANRKAALIEGSTDYQRNIAHELDETMDEEAKFSAVDRGKKRGGKNSSRGQEYIPDSRRSHRDSGNRDMSYIRPPPTQGARRPGSGPSPVQGGDRSGPPNLSRSDDNRPGATYPPRVPQVNAGRNKDQKDGGAGSPAGTLSAAHSGTSISYARVIDNHTPPIRGGPVNTPPPIKSPHQSSAPSPASDTARSTGRKQHTTSVSSHSSATHREHRTSAGNINENEVANIQNINSLKKFSEDFKLVQKPRNEEPLQVIRSQGQPLSSLRMGPNMALDKPKPGLLGPQPTTLSQPTTQPSTAPQIPTQMPPQTNPSPMLPPGLQQGHVKLAPYIPPNQHMSQNLPPLQINPTILQGMHQMTNEILMSELAASANIKLGAASAVAPDLPSLSTEGSTANNPGSSREQSRPASRSHPAGGVINVAAIPSMTGMMGQKIESMGMGMDVRTPRTTSSSSDAKKRFTFNASACVFKPRSPGDPQSKATTPKPAGVSTPPAEVPTMINTPAVVLNPDAQITTIQQEVAAIPQVLPAAQTPVAISAPVAMTDSGAVTPQAVPAVEQQMEAAAAVLDPRAVAQVAAASAAVAASNAGPLTQNQIEAKNALFAQTLATVPGISSMIAGMQPAQLSGFIIEQAAQWQALTQFIANQTEQRGEAPAAGFQQSRVIEQEAHRQAPEPTQTAPPSEVFSGAETPTPALDPNQAILQQLQLAAQIPPGALPPSALAQHTAAMRPPSQPRPPSNGRPPSQPPQVHPLPSHQASTILQLAQSRQGQQVILPNGMTITPGLQAALNAGRAGQPVDVAALAAQQSQMAQLQQVTASQQAAIPRSHAVAAQLQFQQQVQQPGPPQSAPVGQPHPSAHGVPTHAPPAMTGALPPNAAMLQHLAANSPYQNIAGHPATSQHPHLQTQLQYGQAPPQIASHGPPHHGMHPVTSMHNAQAVSLIHGAQAPPGHMLLQKQNIPIQHSNPAAPQPQHVYINSGHPQYAQIMQQQQQALATQHVLAQQSQGQPGAPQGIHPGALNQLHQLQQLAHLSGPPGAQLQHGAVHGAAHPGIQQQAAQAQQPHASHAAWYANPQQPR